MSRVIKTAAGLALALFAIGVAVLPLQAPWFTRALASRYAQSAEAGLSATAMLDVAEQVRAFVVDGQGELPARVGGRDGFDPLAVSHLEDVREVLRGARIATAVLGAAVLSLAAALIALGRKDLLAGALRTGGVLTVLIPAAGALAGFADFDALFGAFHGLFFEAGTWTFPYDSLLIRTFPEPFWVVSGVAWAGLVAVIAGGYGAAGLSLGRRAHAPREVAPSAIQH